MSTFYVKLVIFSTKWIKSEEKIFTPYWSGDVIYNKMITGNKQQVDTVINKPEVEELVQDLEKYNNFSYQLFTTKVSPLEMNKSKLYNDPFLRQYIRTRKRSKWIYNDNENCEYLCENVYKVFKN